MRLTSLPLLLAAAAAVLCPRPPLPPTPGPAATAVWIGPGDACARTPAGYADDRLELRARLNDIFDGQTPEGYLNFGVEDSLLYYHPVLASLSLEVYRQTADAEWLEKARSAISAYYNYLLVHCDSDDDFLIERTAYRHISAPRSAAVEGVGFNMMIALDMLNLSRICLELKSPVEALFWYQGTKTVGAALIASAYDYKAGYFLPAPPAANGADPGRRMSAYLALSALPVYLHRELGDNISRSILRNYVLTPQKPPHENPLSYLDWVFDSTQLTRTRYDERLLRAILLVGALEWNGLAKDAREHALSIRARLSEEPSGSEPAGDRGIYALIFERMLSDDSGPELFPRYYELELLDLLVFQKSLLNSPQTANFRNGISAVSRFLTRAGSDAGQTPHTDADEHRGGAPTEDRDLQAVTESIRDVYIGISVLREHHRNRTLYPPRLRDKLPGFDIYAATGSLWNDVIESLHDAETAVARNRTMQTGLEVAASLGNESAAPNSPINAKFTLSALRRPATVRSVVLFFDEAVDTLLGTAASLTLNPGAPAIEFARTLPARGGHTSVIQPVRFSLEIRLDDGQRNRWYFRRGVYITEALSYHVTFPMGTILDGGSVPIRIDVDKHTQRGAVIRAEWFSPTGLKPIEGRSIESWIPEQTDRVSFDLNIRVPTPCRPGAFPFVLKLFANGADLGTVQSSLFKHYQWLFVGPFTDKLDTTYPPQSRINLLDSYAGAGRQVSWAPLSPSGYADGGSISLDGKLPQGSVGFLYTVIHSEHERSVTVLFGSHAPGTLYLNGDEIMRIRGGAESAVQRAAVVLKQGMNNVLIKILAQGPPLFYFQLGEEQDMTSDEFNNNLWELVDGYDELKRRGSESKTGEGDAQRRVTLTYRDPNANSVAVVGNFNGWSSANSTMRKNKYGEWEINLYLAPGRYAYRFLVNNSDEVLDPNSAHQEPDGYGSRNSVLFVQ